MPRFHESMGGRPIMYDQFPEALRSICKTGETAAEMVSVLARIANALERGRKVEQEIVPIAKASQMLSNGYRWVDKFIDGGETFAVFEREVSSE